MTVLKSGFIGIVSGLLGTFGMAQIQPTDAREFRLKVIGLTAGVMFTGLTSFATIFFQYRKDRREERLAAAKPNGS